MSDRNIKKLPLNHEETRLLSFKNWNGTNMDTKQNNEFKERLARAGFHLCQKSQKIKCYYCNIGIGNWMYEHNPFIEHKTLSKECPFITLKPTNNVCSPGKESLMAIEFIVLSNYTIPNNDNNVKIKFDDVRKSAKHPNFAKKEDRLKTFDKWSTTAPVTKEELVNAGFFYIENRDGLACFSCGNGLSTFLTHDNPMIAHKLSYPNCLFIKFVTRTKASPEQMKCLSDYLLKHPLALDQPKKRGSLEWNEWKKLWEELTIELNNTNGPKKSMEEWQGDTLRNWKCNQKRKDKKKDGATDELAASNEEIQQPSTSGYSS